MLGLTSDAAYRYERGVDPAGTRASIERATALTLEICGGRAGPLTHAEGELPRRRAVNVRPARVRALLGYPIDDAEMKAILTRLACAVEGGDPMKVTAPSWRFDLEIEEDFVEEIARIHGYEHVPAVAPRSSIPMLGSAEGTPQPLRPAPRARAPRLPGGRELQLRLRGMGARFRRQCESRAPRQPDREPHERHAHDAPGRADAVAALEPESRRAARARVRDRALLRRRRGRRSPSSPSASPASPSARGCPEQWAARGEAIDFFDAKGDVEALAGSTALAFEAVSHPALPPRPLRRGSPARRAHRGGRGAASPPGQQQCELPGPAVVFELLTGPLLAGPSAPFPGPFPHAGGAPGLCLHRGRNHPRRGHPGGPERRGFRASSGRWKCSISTAERASRLAKKALPYG